MHEGFDEYLALEMTSIVLFSNAIVPHALRVLAL